jgi:hypothetical protein
LLQKIAFPRNFREIENYRRFSKSLFQSFLVRAVDRSHALANAALSLFISAAPIASFDGPCATDCYRVIEMQEMNECHMHIRVLRRTPGQTLSALLAAQISER